MTIQAIICMPNSHFLAMFVEYSKLSLPCSPPPSVKLDHAGGLGSPNDTIHRGGSPKYQPLDIEAALKAVRSGCIEPNAIF
jgi:hypothetical protein